MKIWAIENFGGPDVFHLLEAAAPQPGPGEVVLRVAATSVNPVDAKIRSGAAAALAPAFPAILHGDVAGIVESVGEGVKDFVPGQAVYGCAGGVRGHGGALADRMRADARLLAPKPRSLSFAQAAALPLVTITAWEGLDKAGVKPGDTLLAHGATGGVGHVVVQLARARGARVVATFGRESKRAAAEAIAGRETLVNYREEDVASYVGRFTAGRGFDVVFDTAGGDNIGRSAEAARPNGSVVTIQARSTMDLSPLHAKALSLHVVFMLLPLLTGEGRERHGRILREAGALADAGRLVPLIDPSDFTFHTIGAAHAHLESGRAVGKIVVRHPEWSGVSIGGR